MYWPEHSLDMSETLGGKARAGAQLSIAMGLGEVLNSHAQDTETWREADRYLGGAVQMS